MSNDIGIVLVDDNDIDLMIGERLISVINPDVRVVAFPCGKELIAWLSSKEHTCIARRIIIFIDIYMPEMNGFMVAEQAHQILTKKGCKAECYLLSATIDDSDLQKIKNHPLIAGFVGKPITPAIINKLIRELDPV